MGSQRKFVTVSHLRSVIMCRFKFVIMSQEKYQNKSAKTFLFKLAEQENKNNVEIFQDKFVQVHRGKHAKQSKNSSVRVSPKHNVKVFQKGLQGKSAKVFLSKNAQLLQENSAGQAPDKSVSKLVNNSVPLHPGKNAEVFRHNNVRLSQRKFRDKSVKMFPSRNVPVSPMNSAEMFLSSSAPVFQS